MNTPSRERPIFLAGLIVLYSCWPRGRTLPRGSKSADRSLHAGSAVAGAGSAGRAGQFYDQGGQPVFWGCSAAVLRVGGVAALVLRVLA